MNFNIYILLIFSFIYSYNTAVSIVPEKIFLGDLTTITFKINNLNNQCRAVFPSLIIQNNDISIYNGIVNDTMAEYKCQFWATKQMIFPEQLVYIEDSTDNVIDSIKIESFNFIVLPSISDTSKTIKNIKNNFNIYFNYYKIKGISFLLFVSGVILLSFFIKRKIIKKDLFVHLKINFLKESITKIQKLRIPENNITDIQSFNLKISNIFKEYLKNTLYIHSTEMTFNELIDYFKKEPHYKDLLKDYSRLFTQIEKLKFDKHEINVFNIKPVKDNVIILMKKLDQIRTRLN